MAYHFVTTANLSLTQGAIVQGLRIPGYEKPARHGVLITARCDVAHIRASTINFLPVVPLESWLKNDGALSILLARINSLESKTLERIEELDEGLLFLCRGQDPLVVLDHFATDATRFPRDKVAQIRDGINAMARFRDLYREAIRRGSPDTQQDGDLARLIDEQASKKLHQLLKNEIADVHFIPSIDTAEPLDQCNGYVIMFRDILGVPGVIADRLLRGIETSELKSDENLARLLGRSLWLDDETIGIISNVVSPHTEHILQRFAAVFSRIGVEDLTLRYRRELVGRVSRRKV